MRVQGQMTTEKYRAIDLSLFALILMVFETVIVRAATQWFPKEAWTVSAVAAITAIVMVRWGPWAGIHAVLGGIVFVLTSRGGLNQYVIYGVGNLAGLAVLPLLKKWGWRKLKENVLVNFLYGALVLLGMQVGRGLISLLFGASPAVALGFITTDVISYIFTLVILWIVARLDGMLEDQRHYLKRLSEQREKEGGFQ